MQRPLIVLSLILATGAMAFHLEERHAPVKFPWAISHRQNTTKTDGRSEWDSCDCGDSPLGNAKIMGGTDAEEGEFPWVVGLLIEMETESGKTEWFSCGGTIISPNYVMSAAHCVLGKQQKLKQVQIFAGATGNAAGTKYVSESAMTGDYNGSINDISLIKVKGGITFNKNVKPACMPYGLPGDWTGKVWASGWGIESQSGSSSSSSSSSSEDKASSAQELQKAVLTVISNEKCGQMWESSIPDTQVCTYDKGKTTCSGDSGSPLSVKLNDGKWAAFGIVSYGFQECNPKVPAVYTKVSSYVGWLEENTGEKFCKK